MNKVLLLIIFLVPYQLHALSCKCNCGFADVSVCASSYDIDHPCTGLCPAAAPGIAPMPTACPPVEVYNPIKQTNELKVICNE